MTICERCGGSFRRIILAVLTSLRLTRSTTALRRTRDAMPRSHEEAAEEARKLDEWVRGQPLAQVLNEVLPLTSADCELIGRMIQADVFH